MDQQRFNTLHPRLQRAYMLGKAANILGRDYVVKAGKTVTPAVRDNIGHDFPLGPYYASGERDPEKNFWHGAWRVYDLG